MDIAKQNLNEKVPIILEMGNMYTRMGFAGEDCPRKVIFTPKTIRRFLTTATSESLSDIGKRIQIEFDIEAFLNNMFFNDLLLNLKERQLIFIENLFINRDFVTLFAKVAIQRFFITKIYFFLSNALPLYLSALPTGLVIDCGYMETHITPIFEGYPVMRGFRFVPTGGKLLSEKLRQRIITENPPKLADIVDSQMLEDLKAKSLLLLLKNQKIDYFSSEEKIQKMKEKLYNFDSEKKIFKISYYTRVIVSEALFGDIMKDEANIAYEILKSISFIDVESAQKVTQNILICGGAALLPNFAKRLRQELIYFLENTPEFHRFKKIFDMARFTNYIYPTSVANFVGASIMGSLNGIEEFAYCAPKDDTEIKVLDRYGDAYIRGFNEIAN